MPTISETERVTQLMNSRRGKKGSITKRIAQINQIVEDGGSRSQVLYLIEALLKVQQALQAVCEELNTLTPDTDTEYLDNENFRIDTCISEAKGYLERRRLDPPSTDPLTESWVHQHAAGNDLASVSDARPKDGVGVMTDDFAAMSTVLSSETNQFIPSSTFLKSAHLSWNQGGQQSVFVTSEQRFASTGSIYTYTQPQSYENQHGSSHSIASVMNNVTGSYTQPQSYENQHGPSYSIDSVMSNVPGSIHAYTQPQFYENQHRPSYSIASVTNNVPVVSTTAFAMSAADTASGTRAIPSMGGILNQQQNNSLPILQPHRNRQYEHRHPQNHSGGAQNQVDSWIDTLTENNVEVAPNPNANHEHDITMGFFIQQSLPRMDVPLFNGSPFMWVEFITKFRDLIHDQPYLNVLRKSTLLLQHLKNEAKRSVQGFPNNAVGYVSSLKRLKFLFGQKGKIAQATIRNITEGKEVPDNNAEALSELYYSISDCLVTLTQLNYVSDVYSSHTLREVVLRLPRRLQDKWADISYSIRSRSEDPNLVHLESWLQTRVMALKENYRLDKK